MSKVNKLHNKISENLYVQLLKVLEDSLIVIKDNVNWDISKIDEMLDLIIKIKTIQAMDRSAELIEASRKVSRN